MNLLALGKRKPKAVKVVAISELDRLIGHPLPEDTLRPQADLAYWDLSAWDAEVCRACETAEQRKSARNRGKKIEVVLRANQEWSTWRMAAEIWLWTRKGCNGGVTVYFEDPGDVPRYSFWALVRTNGRKT